jgi:hypothetical protein
MSQAWLMGLTGHGGCGLGKSNESVATPDLYDISMTCATSTRAA